MSRAAVPEERRSPGITYSPLRLKYPYVRGSLLQMFREARARLGDPVDGVGGDRR